MVKVEFIKTTYDVNIKKSYRAGLVTEIEEDFFERCKKLGAIRAVITNVPEVQAEELKEKIEAAKEEEQKKQEETEKAIEQALIKQEEELNMTEYVKGLKLAELKGFAKANDINLKGKTKKADILDIILDEIHKG